MTATGYLYSPLCHPEECQPPPDKPVVKIAYNVPVNLSFVIQYYSYNNGVTVFLNESQPMHIVVSSHSKITINVTRMGSFARVIVTYPDKPGSKNVVQEVIKVEFT